MNNEHVKYHVRHWLNAKNGLAAIEATITRNHSRSITADIDINDCSHSIMLDFGVWDGADIPGIRSKIDLLVNTLIDFRTALDIELTELAALPDSDPDAPWHEELEEPEICGR